MLFSTISTYLLLLNFSIIYTPYFAHSINLFAGAMVTVTKVHSWVVVVKGGRTRICLDTSKLVNPFVPSIPFNLPQFDEVSKYAKQGSYLAKFDLRDFFWNLNPQVQHILE